MSLFPAEIIAYAQQAEKQTGCLASVALAQWALESAYGKSVPRGSNNPFGIKAVGNQPFVIAGTQEQLANARYIKIAARFRKFPSVLESFLAHGRLLMSPNGPYRGCLPYAKQWDKWVDMIGPIYATDRKYSQKIKQIIVKNRLYQYDLKRTEETPVR